MNTSYEALKVRAVSLNIYDIAKHVFDHPKFQLWSGSSKPYQHHYGRGGLCQHTSEVVSFCEDFNIMRKLNIDPVELYLSALFHDYGKLWDYTPKYKNLNDPRGDSTDLTADFSAWYSTDHKRLIHHISRSAIEFNKLVVQPDLFGKYGKYADSVTHNILAHHGQREWGSPVLPKTKAAWLLHLCDGISARMNDADKWDQVVK